MNLGSPSGDTGPQFITSENTAPLVDSKKNSTLGVGSPQKPRVQFSECVATRGKRVESIDSEAGDMEPEVSATMPLADDKDTRSAPDGFRLDSKSRMELQDVSVLGGLASEFVEWSRQDPRSAQTVDLAGKQWTIGDQREKAAGMIVRHGAKSPGSISGCIELLQVLQCETLYVRIPEEQGVTSEQSLPVTPISPQMRTVTTEKGQQKKLFIWVHPPVNADEGAVKHLRGISTVVDEKRQLFCLSSSELVAVQPKDCPGDLDTALREFSEWNSTAPDFNATYYIRNHPLKVGKQRLLLARQYAEAKPDYPRLVERLALLRSTHPEVLGCNAKVRLTICLKGQRPLSLEDIPATDEKASTRSHDFLREKLFTQVLYGVQLESETTDPMHHQQLSSLAEDVVPATHDQKAIYFLCGHRLRAENDWGDAESTEFVDARMPVVPEDSKHDRTQAIPEAAEPPLVDPTDRQTDSQQPLLHRPDQQSTSASDLMNTQAYAEDDPSDDPACCLIL